MKLRATFVLALLAVLLTACSFSLAEDITPPPNYVSPTPVPTLGPIYPQQAPMPAQGAAIFMEKCAPCHGETGLGDGPQGSQLSVTVPGLGIEEIAYPAIPSEWFSVVKQGRIQRFMPPFSGSLNDQQIWDVIAYAFTLSTTPDQVAQGKTLYTASCAECHGENGSKIATADFTNQEFMAKRTINDLARAITNGTNNMPAFANLTEDETLALAAYVRTLSFDQAVAAATPVAPTPEPVATTAGSADAESTPAAEPTSAESAATVGNIQGTVAMADGSKVPAGLEITLHVFDHGGDPSAGPVEILTLQTTPKNTGQFAFEDVELGEGRFFYAETIYQNIPYQTEVVVSEAGMTEIDLGAATLYETTPDFSVLSLDQFHMFFDFTQDGVLNIYQIYIMSNASDKTVALETDLSSIPFIVLPEGAVNFGIDSGDGPFVGTETGFAMPPSETQYQLQVFFSLPYENKKADITQAFAMNMQTGSVLIPNGVKLKSDTLGDGQPQDMGGQQYMVYRIPALSANDTVSFTISGKPSTTASGLDTIDSNTGILIGVGVLGVALIAAGVFLYLRDRKSSEEEELDEEDEEDEDAEETDEGAENIMDAIIALDDQFRNGNISKEAYEQRRAELKAQLKKTL